MCRDFRAEVCCVKTQLRLDTMKYSCCFLAARITSMKLFFFSFFINFFPELILWRGEAGESHQSLREGQEHTSPSGLTLKSH